MRLHIQTVRLLAFLTTCATSVQRIKDTIRHHYTY